MDVERKRLAEDDRRRAGRVLGLRDARSRSRRQHGRDRRRRRARSTAQLPLRQFDIAAGSVAEALRAFEAASGHRRARRLRSRRARRAAQPGVDRVAVGCRGARRGCSPRAASGIASTGRRVATLTLPTHERIDRRLRAGARDRLAEIHAAAARHAAHGLGHPRRSLPRAGRDDAARRAAQHAGHHVPGGRRRRRLPGDVVQHARLQLRQRHHCSTACARSARTRATRSTSSRSK